MPPQVVAQPSSNRRWQPWNDPRPGRERPAIWQFYALGWQAFAEHLIGQRVDTAMCLAQLRARGVIK